jgi:hypothetical protein
MQPAIGLARIYAQQDAIARKADSDGASAICTAMEYSFNG